MRQLASRFSRICLNKCLDDYNVDCTNYIFSLDTKIIQNSPIQSSQFARNYNSYFVAGYTVCLCHLSNRSHGTRLDRVQSVVLNSIWKFARRFMFHIYIYSYQSRRSFRCNNTILKYIKATSPIQKHHKVSHSLKIEINPHKHRARLLSLLFQYSYICCHSIPAAAMLSYMKMVHCRLLALKAYNKYIYIQCMRQYGGRLKKGDNNRSFCGISMIPQRSFLNCFWLWWFLAAVLWLKNFCLFVNFILIHDLVIS